MPQIRSVLPFAVILALGACNEPVALFGGEDDAETAAQQAAAEAEAQVPILSVREIEIGRMRNGFLVTAYGKASGPGYSQPTLRPRRGGAPGPDGYIVYDFVATPPAPDADLPSGTERMRRLTAYLPVEADDLRGAAGIRVMGMRGGAQLDFRRASSPETDE